MKRKKIQIALILATLASGLVAQTSSALNMAPGKGINIDTGKDGTIFAVGPQVNSLGEGFIFSWNGKNWEEFINSSSRGYRATRIAVDPLHRPWFITGNQTIFRNQGSSFYQLPGTARDIDIGANGDVFIIGTDNPAPGNGSVYKWNGQAWIKFGGYGKRIAVDGTGRPWIVNALNEIWRYTASNRWERIPGGAIDIASGPQSGNAVHILGTDQKIYKFNNGGWINLGGRGSNIAVHSNGQPIVTNNLKEIWGPFDRPPTLADFGHQSIKPVPRIPMLVIDLSFADLDFRANHTKEHFEDLYFGIHGLEKNVRSYFAHNSNGRFAIGRQHDVVEVRHRRTKACALRQEGCTNMPGGTDLNGFAEVMAEPELSGIDFRVYDTNHDGRISNSELIIVFNQALPLEESQGGATRSFPTPWPNTGCVDAPGGVKLCTNMVLVGEGTGLDTIAHEISHTLGTEDVYGAESRMNGHYTLMAGTVALNEDNHKIYHLDPLHKMKLGWIEPKIVAISPSEPQMDLNLRANEHGIAEQPVIFYDPNFGHSQFYMVEQRNRRADSFDSEVGDSGIVAWYVRYGTGFYLQNRRAFIDTGENKNLESTVSILDSILGEGWIGWGSDQILQSVAGGDDHYQYDKANFVLTPQGTYGGGDAWDETSGVLRAKWPDTNRASGLQMKVLQIDGETSRVRFQFRGTLN